MDGEILQIKWRTWSSTLNTVSEELFDSDLFCDLHLIAENKVIKCHKVLMTNASLTLSMLLKNTSSDLQPVIFSDEKYEALRAIVQLIYTGSVTVPFYLLEDFLKLKHRLGILALSPQAVSPPHWSRISNGHQAVYDFSYPNIEPLSYSSQNNSIRNDDDDDSSTSGVLQIDETSSLAENDYEMADSVSSSQREVAETLISFGKATSMNFKLRKIVNNNITKKKTRQYSHEDLKRAVIASVMDKEAKPKELISKFGLARRTFFRKTKELKIIRDQMIKEKGYFSINEIPIDEIISGNRCCRKKANSPLSQSPDISPSSSSQRENINPERDGQPANDVQKIKAEVHVTSVAQATEDSKRPPIESLNIKVPLQNSTNSSSGS